MLNWIPYVVITGCKNNCGLKICTEKCQNKLKRHSENECLLVKDIQDKNPNQWLTVLRVLNLRKSKPEAWNKFLILEDHIENRKNCPIMKRNKSSVWNILKTFVPELVEDLTYEDIMKICGILDSNCFRIDKNGTRGLFLATSMLNHNCLPNARIVFDHKGEVGYRLLL